MSEDTSASVQDQYTREPVTCNICGVDDAEIQCYAPEQIVKCRRCDLMYVNPRLDNESLKKIYSEEYFLVDLEKVGVDYPAYADYIGDEPVIMKSMLRRTRKVEKYARTKGLLLDVGCAAGFSLLAAEQRGWKAQGIEFSQFCVDYAKSRNLNVHHGSLDDFEAEDESFDAVTMWDYLEHSTDPVGNLRTCNKLLKPGGVIVLSIPNVDSWSYRLLKEKWIGFKNIEHFYFYSRKTIAKVAELAGFNMEDDFYHGKYVALSFCLSRAQYYTSFKPLLAIIAAMANNSLTKNISFYINPYDILNVVLRKL